MGLEGARRALARGARPRSPRGRAVIRAAPRPARPRSTGGSCRRCSRRPAASTRAAPPTRPRRSSATARSAGTWLTARRLCRCHPFHPGGDRSGALKRSREVALGPRQPSHPARHRRLGRRSSLVWQVALPAEEEGAAAGARRGRADQAPAAGAPRAAGAGRARRRPRRRRDAPEETVRRSRATASRPTLSTPRRRAEGASCSRARSSGATQSGKEARSTSCASRPGQPYPLSLVASPGAGRRGRTSATDPAARAPMRVSREGRTLGDVRGARGEPRRPEDATGSPASRSRSRSTSR